MAADLIDPQDGENRAVRCFLMQYGVPGLTVGAMQLHMIRYGFPHWPAWVEVGSSEHLTKGGAQAWLRHLFALESAPGVPVLEAPSGGVVWTPEDETRLDAAIAKRNAARAAHGVNEGARAMHPDCTAPDCDCEPGIECAARGASRGVIASSVSSMQFDLIDAARALQSAAEYVTPELAAVYKARAAKLFDAVSTLAAGVAPTQGGQR